MAKTDGGGTGLFAQANREMAAAKETQATQKAGKPSAGAGAASTRDRSDDPHTHRRRVTRPPSTGKVAKPSPSATRPPKKK